MPEPGSTTPRIRIGPLVFDVLFYGLFLIHLLVAVEPRLIYVSQGPVFLTGSDFFLPFLKYPGGLMEYIHLALAQLNAWGWPGALAMTAIAFLIGKLSKALFTTLCYEKPATNDRQRHPGWLMWFAQYIPSIPLLMFFTQYDVCHVAAPSLLAMLTMAVLYSRLAGRPAAIRVPAYLAGLFVVYYFLAGSTVFGSLRDPSFQLAATKPNMLLTVAGFSLLCGLCELRTGRAWFFPLYLVLGAGLAMAGEHTLTVMGLAGLRFRVSSNSILWHAVAVLCVVPLEAIVLVVVQRVWRSLVSIRRKRHPFPPEADPARQPGIVWRMLTATLGATLLLALLAGTSAQSWNGTRKRQLKFDFLRANERWNEILASARHIHPSQFDPLMRHDVNTALFETGRLACDLFEFPQTDPSGRPYEMLFLLHDVNSYPYLYRQMDQNIRLGRLNDAEHVAFEALALVGPRAQLLQKIATIKMIKGQPAAARIFLHRLERDVVYRNGARRYLDMIARIGDVADDREMLRLRSQCLQKDDVTEVYTFQPNGPVYAGKMLANLLKQNPRNRMAFEYLMGAFLLNRMLPQVARRIADLDQVGYTDVPRLYEEALVLYQAQNKTPVKLPGGRKIRQDTLDRYGQMVEIAKKYGNDPYEALAKVQEQGLQSSYFFYAMSVPEGAKQ
jgi:hypothetical protein